jgi:hypothetical protein
VTFQQLVLPFEDVIGGGQAHGIKRTRRIFVNRDLRLTGAAYIGFDMDYTLAIYDQPEMDHLSIQATAQKLVKRGYPEHILDIPVRHAVSDPRSSHRQALRPHPEDGPLQGRAARLPRLRQLSKEELRTLYQSKKIRPTTPRYHWIDTLYALSEAALYAAIVDSFEKRGLASTHASLSPISANASTRPTATARSSTPVIADLPRFVVRDAELAPRSTSSAAPATSCSPDQLALVRTPTHDDVPARRLDDRVPDVAALLRRRHRRRAEAGLLPTARPLEERVGDELRPATHPLERGKSTRAATSTTSSACSASPAIASSTSATTSTATSFARRKRSSWRTAMIIQEMEAEVLAHDACASDLARIDELQGKRDKLEDELRYYQARYKDFRGRSMTPFRKGEMV